MSITAVIETLINQRFRPQGIRHIFLVACGGSLVDMYPAKYFLDSEASQIPALMLTANEFVYAPPKALGAGSLVIVCSHGGNTPESVAAAKLARERGAGTLTLTHNADAQLIAWADHNLLYQWGNDSRVTDNPMALILSLCVEALQQSGGYAGYADFRQGMSLIDPIIARACRQVRERSRQFAARYQHEPLFYILSSGPSFGHAYGFAICSLMEMQRLHAAAIHSGEFFHGPFEVVDKSVPFILLKNQGRTRPLDQRVQDFLRDYAEKVEVVDAAELGLAGLPESVAEYFNPVLFYSVMCEYRLALSLLRQHPLETRRYMGKVAY